MGGHPHWTLYWCRICGYESDEAMEFKRGKNGPVTQCRKCDNLLRVERKRRSVLRSSDKEVSRMDPKGAGSSMNSMSQSGNGSKSAQQTSLDRPRHGMLPGDDRETAVSKTIKPAGAEIVRNP